MEKVGDAWERVQLLSGRDFPGGLQSQGSSFGRDIAYSGDQMVVAGAQRLHTYSWVDGVWVYQDTRKLEVTISDSFFLEINALAFSQDQLLVGLSETPGLSEDFVIHAYPFSDTGLGQDYLIYQSPSGNTGNGLGAQLVYQDGYLYAAAPLEDIQGDNSGAVYAYKEFSNSYLAPLNELFSADTIAADSAYSLFLDPALYSEIGTPDQVTITVYPGDRPLPDWLQFDPQSGLLSGTPSMDDLGVVQMKIQIAKPGNAGYQATFRLSVLDGRVVGLPQETILGKVYPNPSCGRYTLQLPASVKVRPESVRVYSIMGLEQPFTVSELGSQYQIELAPEAAPGLYWLEFYEQSGRHEVHPIWKQ